MSDYYCYPFAVKHGIIKPSSPTNLTGQAYQLEKFIKHTAPTGSYSINSVFDNPAYSNYKNYIVNGLLSGCAEIDDKNRLNLIWYAGERVGLTHSGSFVTPASGVKIVFHDNQTKIHQFPCNPPIAKTCKICGRIIPY